MNATKMIFVLKGNSVSIQKDHTVVKVSLKKL